MLYRLKNVIFIASALMVLLSSYASAETITVRHNRITDMGAKEQYQYGLLKLALSYDKQNSYEFEESTRYLPQIRMIEDIMSDNLEIAWTGTSIDLEEKLQPIRIPLYKGLLGHRIFIIRADNQYKFDRVNSFEDLKQLTAAQERTWADTAILRNAGIRVFGTRTYDNLFYMLEGGRYDYFPRGVHEPWSEVASHSELPLTIEKRILIKYPLPAYFFVSKNNTQLARAIKTGLISAIEDGKFDEYFFNNPMIRDVIRKADLENRKIFEIENPFIPKETPFDDKRLWLHIDDLKNHHSVINMASTNQFSVTQG
ncbi:transporter substrate-binding domain-containing protein [Algibacillus agarilyticus]|uniref:transporter substrate-binding domain-containing protein n=1 Tax=Algibacillus agarilyticus TaxID=2234133 RepID=UPI000DD02503|nr:transporter substrate-binding domain-containing protein [Algibacillus agarilyticus]